MNIPEKHYVRYWHFHDGNSTKEERHGHKFVTMCELIDGNTNKSVSNGHAFCGRRDTPSRAKGREISLGRCLKKYYSNI